MERIEIMSKFFIFLMFSFCTVIKAGMNVNVWWTDDPTVIEQNQNSIPCKISTITPANQKLAALLTLSFDRNDGMEIGQLDFIDLMAKKVGDSLGFNTLIRSGCTEFTMQYGHSTGILGSVKYKCYTLKNRKTSYDDAPKSYIYDTVPVYVYDTITQVKDSIRFFDTVKVPIYYPEHITIFDTVKIK
jgi:hypothetical protein